MTLARLSGTSWKGRESWWSRRGKGGLSRRQRRETRLLARAPKSVDFGVRLSWKAGRRSAPDAVASTSAASASSRCWSPSSCSHSSSAPVSYVLITTLKSVENLPHAVPRRPTSPRRRSRRRSTRPPTASTRPRARRPPRRTRVATRFKVSVTFQLVAGSGRLPTLCTGRAGTTSSKIWSVNADVSWGEGTEGEVVETTLVSPSYADLGGHQCRRDGRTRLQPVENLETATPINITVQGSCNGGCGTIPGNEDAQRVGQHRDVGLRRLPRTSSPATA